MNQENATDQSASGDACKAGTSLNAPMAPGSSASTLSRPHSATRFILPFKLSIAAKKLPRVESGGTDRKPYYRRMDKEDKNVWIWENIEAREKYFTAETRDVMFARATWWVMTGEPKPLTMTAPDGQELFGKVLPPALVLFEDNCGEELLRHGFLVVEVAFQEGDNAALRLDDLLLFNELFRYWRKPYDKHNVEFERQLVGIAKAFDTTSDSYEERWLSMLRVPLNDGRVLLEESSPAPKDISKVPSDDHVEHGRVSSEEISKKDKAITMAIAMATFGDYADDRAFVWTRALCSKTEMNFIIPHTGAGDKWRAEENPETGLRSMFGYWIKLLNVDKPSLRYSAGKIAGYEPSTTTNIATAFERKWVDERTYRRWEHYNCYYGFNSFSAAMMAEPFDDPPTWQHWFQMYFDQVLLLLYLRVTLFRFSGELTTITGNVVCASAKAESEQPLDEWKIAFRKLRRAFTCFENLYQFPLLSNQQQAIEMYTFARKNMDIDDLYAEVSKQIASSDELLSAEVEERRNKLSYSLNKLAVFGFGVSAAFGMFQIPGLTDWLINVTLSKAPINCTTDSPCANLILFVSFVVVWSVFFWFLQKRHLKNNK
jgi:hypothetical protein